LKTTSIVLLWLAGLHLACASSPNSAGKPNGPGATDAQAPLDPRAPGASVFCGSRESVQGTPEPELYMLAAINHKLDSYPELAAAVGLATVDDCEGARRYSDVYVEYSVQHPRFDADEAVAPMPEGDDAPPDDSQPATEVQKIANGDVATDDPIVRIEFPIWPQTAAEEAKEPGDASWGTNAAGMPDADSDPRGKTSFCTGTFIGKNWILTAAHCLTFAAINTCIRAGIARSACTPDWPQWGQWTLRGSRNGTQYVIKNVWARGYVHPNWLGTMQSSNPELCPPAAACYDRQLGAAHDLALLYVHSSQDDKLPPDLENNGAKRLSIVPPDPQWPVTFAGWGDPVATDSQGNPTPVLRVGTSPVNLTFPNNGLRDEVITASIPTTTDSFPCRGDSGGPLLRTDLSLDTNTGPKAMLEAVVGVMSFGYSLCAPLSDGHFYWTLVNAPKNLSFIESTLKRWSQYQHLTCAKRRNKGDPLPPEGPVAAVEECWGAPCVADGPATPGVGCALSTDTCWHAARSFASQSSCDACSGAGGGCGCIVGQCLPTK
jgi:hypothetical protein